MCSYSSPFGNCCNLFKSKHQITAHWTCLNCMSHKHSMADYCSHHCLVKGRPLSYGKGSHCHSTFLKFSDHYSIDAKKVYRVFNIDYMSGYIQNIVFHAVIVIVISVLIKRSMVELSFTLTISFILQVNRIKPKIWMVSLPV